MNKPFLPADYHPDSVRELSMRSLARACIAIGQRTHSGVPGMSGASPLLPNDILRARGWDDDRVAKLVIRAATSPATTTTTGWAAELATVAMAFLASLRPMSAGADLLGQCLSLSFGAAAQIRLPTINPAGAATFVSEGQPIRVSQLPTTAGPTMERYKLAGIVELTSEMMEHSDAERIVTQALIDSTGPGLDAALFSNAAAVPGLRPAGILNGATSITASTATSKVDAMDDDLCGLVEIVAPYVGNNGVAFICAPPQATRIALRAERTPFPVLASGALAAKTVICVATNAIASALEPVQIDEGKSVLLHEEDTTPLPISVPGTPAATVASPTRSLWQTDSVALRLRLPLSWLVRDVRAVSFVTNTKW
jgi:capsid protein